MASLLRNTHTNCSSRSRIKIIAATYGPAKQQHQQEAGVVQQTGTRNVKPFLKALLFMAQQQQEQQQDQDTTTTTAMMIDEDGKGGGGGGDRDSNDDNRQPQNHGLYIPLMDGKTMNAIFGDPCPGTSKQLFVHYVVYDSDHVATRDRHSTPARSTTTTTTTTTEVHRSTFAEHERVVLRQRVTFYQDEAKLKEAVEAAVAATTKRQEIACDAAAATVSAPTRTTCCAHEKHGEKDTGNADNGNADNATEDSESLTLRKAVQMGRAQSIAEFASQHHVQLQQAPSSSSLSSSRQQALLISNPSAAATSLLLGGVLSAVPKTIGEHPHESTVLRTANNTTTSSTSQSLEPSATTSTTTDAAAATTTTTTTTSTTTTRKGPRLRSATSEIVLPIVLPFLTLTERVHCQLVCKVWRIIVKHWGVAHTVDANDGRLFLHDNKKEQQQQPMFSRAFLRGILSHSYSSLQNLYLCDFTQLAKSDLHPAIPQLRKLRALDISRCNELDDSTLQLIAQHLSHSLEVLYMKGLKQVTDDGFMTLCRSCNKLQVLEISNVKITDQSGIAIGENLIQLRALYMRDNFLLTNQSIDVITEKCTRLAQLTLWGCIRLRSLRFERLLTHADFGNLVLLNLWGCHSLLDEAADALAPMRNLRSLIVSECHRLTDAFLVSLAQNIPKVAHLHLRYCKRVTDAGINAITNAMQDLYSLDLSFCTKISSASILNLLEIRSASLSELRIKNCSQLKISMSAGQRNNGGDGNAGRVILGVLQSSADENCLCLLDVRGCGGHSNMQESYAEDDPFVQGMKSLSFEQVVPGFFTRPARCNDVVIERLSRSLRQSS